MPKTIKKVSKKYKKKSQGTKKISKKVKTPKPKFKKSLKKVSKKFKKNSKFKKSLKKVSKKLKKNSKIQKYKSPKKVSKKSKKAKKSKPEIPTGHQVTITDIIQSAKNHSYPNQYPGTDFLTEHFKIIKDYKKYIDAYKGVCYTEINNYYRTGEILIQQCNTANIDATLTPEQVIKQVAEKLEELYDKVKPLDHDIIVYRGVSQGMLGQNVFDGKCISSVKYNADQHLFCDKEDIVPIPLFKNYDGTDTEKYVIETLGYASVSTVINVSAGFAGNDTLIMYRLPAGTKFIMPIQGAFPDFEHELILFPYNNTFILYDEIPGGFGYNNSSLFVGTFCNELNEFKITLPKKRPFKVKFNNVKDWENDIFKKDPLIGLVLAGNTVGECKNLYTGCPHPYHFCDPETGKCIGDNPDNRKKIKDKLLELNTAGKCQPQKVDECIQNNELCNPQTGDCEKTEKYNNSKFFEYTDPQKIIALQNPRYECTDESIKICADIGELCDPFVEGACTDYNQNNLWFVNNGLSKEDLAKLSPRGKCTKEKIEYFAKNKYESKGYLCDPVTGYEMMYNKENWETFEKYKGKPVIPDQGDYIPLPVGPLAPGQVPWPPGPLPGSVDVLIQEIKNGKKINGNDLKGLLMQKLKYMAKKLNVKIPSSKKKHEIIQILLNKFGGSAEESESEDFSDESNVEEPGIVLETISVPTNPWKGQGILVGTDLLDKFKNDRKKYKDKLINIDQFTALYTLLQLKQLAKHYKTKTSGTKKVILTNIISKLL